MGQALVHERVRRFRRRVRKKLHSLMVRVAVADMSLEEDAVLPSSSVAYERIRRRNWLASEPHTRPVIELDAPVTISGFYAGDTLDSKPFAISSGAVMLPSPVGISGGLGTTVRCLVEDWAWSKTNVRVRHTEVIPISATGLALLQFAVAGRLGTGPKATPWNIAALVEVIKAGVTREHQHVRVIWEYSTTAD